MRILITAGPTREAIDPVRYIGNRSSGRMGAALVAAARQAGHQVTLILGPLDIQMPSDVRRIDIETTSQMHEAVLRELPDHELLIMAAAVADFRPVRVLREKLARGGALTIECEATEDILAAAARIKRPDQRIVGFSLENRGDLARARKKLIEKQLDLIVYNPTDTISSATVEATLLWPNGRAEELPRQSKQDFAGILIARATQLFEPAQRGSSSP